jgi:hypothetical protein
VTEIIRTATFRASDPPALILADLACPRCGWQDPGDAPRRIEDYALHIFCEDCGAFVTVLLDETQARAIEAQLVSPSAGLDRVCASLGTNGRFTVV